MNWFKRKVKPQVGDIWCKDYEDPFSERTAIEILDVREGYALCKYLMVDGLDMTSQSPRSKAVSTIRALYKREVSHAT
mgnify:CR=1 FL=1